MLVVASVTQREKRGRRDEVDFAEIVKLIFDFGRPVLGKHVFQAGADRVTVVMAAVKREGDRRAVQCQKVAVVGVSVAALDVKQSWTPRVAETAGCRSETALITAEDESPGNDDAVVICRRAS